MNTSAQLKAPFLRSKCVFERCIYLLHKRFIEPKSTNEDIRRKEFILNTILCSFIPLLLILDSFILRAKIIEGPAYHGFSLLSFNVILMIFIYSLWLSRSGYHKVATFLILLLYFSATTYGAIHWGVELPLVSISYIVIIIFSGILISTKFALISTLIIATTASAITSLQLHNVIHPLLDWKLNSVRSRDSIELDVFFFLITIISWLSNKEMEQSVRRARNSEKALLEERDLLEVKVEERTTELINLQKDKVAQLYRFAEFGKLSSGAFHDLMNSLNVVVANMERLEHNPAHLPEASTYVARAVSTSKRIGNYVAAVRKQIADNDLLSHFSVQKEIADALDMVHFKARELSVTCTATVDDTIALYGNAVQFYQIILNLLGNAIDACDHIPGQGLVHITARYADDKKDVLITVQDNGCGIDQEIRDKIFTSFFTTKPYGKGIGLGLSHTKEMVERAFGGTIAIQTEKDHGTTFIITIPLSSDDKDRSEHHH